MADYAVKTAEEYGFCVVPEESSLGGDDFSFFEEKIPGCYLKIGTGKGQTIHQPGFRVDRSVILPAAEYLCVLLLGGDSWRKL